MSGVPWNGAARAAGWLNDGHLGRRAFTALAGADMPPSINAAYDVQDALVALRMRQGGGARAGHKIALTTPQMRKFVGYDDSIAGQVLAGGVHRSLATISAASGVHFGFECELAFRLARDTDPAAPPRSRADIAAVIDAACAAFELIDDRSADYARFGKDNGASMLSLAADNAWNHGVVLGDWNPAWHGLDLGAARGVAGINGVEVGSGHGRDVLGHPLDAMLWMARHLHARGQGFKAGEFVITGSLVTSKFPAVGDAVLFTLEGVGEVRMQVTT
jgi:2-keto-4-pentenoate hydratase